MKQHLKTLPIILAISACGGSHDKQSTLQSNDGPNCSNTDRLGMSFCTIPKGTFIMGAIDSDKQAENIEKPRHKVTILNNFELMRTKVTQKMWFDVMKESRSRYNTQEYCPKDFDSRNKLCPTLPVNWTGWHEVVEKFIPALNNQFKDEKFEYRLPTEAEWEYVARGKRQDIYGVDGDLKDFAWFHSRPAIMSPLPVALLKPNAYGLFDILGNYTEWVQNLGIYRSSPITDNPKKIATGMARVIRGCNWGSIMELCRVSARRVVSEHYLGSGFRLVRMQKRIRK